MLTARADPGSEFELALDRHLFRVEILRYRKPPELRHESDALVLRGDLLGAREQKHDGSESTLLREQIHAGGTPVLLALDLQERVLLQLKGQGFLIDVDAGNIVHSHRIAARRQIRRILFMRFHFRGAYGLCAFPADFECRHAGGPALSGGRWPDADESGRSKSLHPNALASSHLAALPAL